MALNKLCYKKLGENTPTLRVFLDCVPLETVLGPILFFIYINGLSEIKSNDTTSSFADDTVIKYSGKS